MSAADFFLAVSGRVWQTKSAVEFSADKTAADICRVCRPQYTLPPTRQSLPDKLWSLRQTISGRLWAESARVWQCLPSLRQSLPSLRQAIVCRIYAKKYLPTPTHLVHWSPVYVPKFEKERHHHPGYGELGQVHCLKTPPPDCSNDLMMEIYSNIWTAQFHFL